jgi:hypothetical protein
VYEKLRDKENSEKCAGCNKPRDKHARVHNEKEWNSLNCTVLEPTDAFGVLKFRGSYTKEAQVEKIKIISPSL